jgi:tRNA(Ile)-lysidine synthase
MLDTLLNFISVQKLFQPEHKILLAVSGGIDSMVMEHLFRQAHFQYAIAHCNFKLRGADSDEDQRWLQQFASQNGVPFYSTSFETSEYAATNHVSTQMAARELRRKWFAELLAKHDFDFIATAHHLNDSIETVIFNLAKGTGISGLKGIAPTKDRYIRPLMFASREMIRKYADENDILWREDSSNKSVKYKRNLIRHKIIPELKKINPSLEQTFSYTAERIAATARIFRTVVDQLKKTLLTETEFGFEINKKKLQSVSESRIVLYDLLEDFGFNYQQVADILQSIDGQPGKHFFAHGFELVIDRKALLISEKKSDSNVSVSISEDLAQADTSTGAITFEKIDRSKVAFVNDDNIAFIDFDKVQFPLTLRHWQPGDHFRPLGMQHKKKLSDFMIDKKIPLNLKKQVLLLVSGKDVVWVVGHRIDDRYKITEQTVNVLKVFKKVKND